MFFKWLVLGKGGVDDVGRELRQCSFSSHSALERRASCVLMEVVRHMFPQHVISRSGDVPWPPHSPDLSICNFFFLLGGGGGYLKSLW
jgi:hypothetical protein